MKGSVRRLSAAPRLALLAAVLMAAAPGATVAAAGSPVAHGGVAVAQSRPVTPLDVAATRSVGEAVMAPDGSAIAYTLSVPRRPGKDPDGPAWSELWVAPFDGGDARGFVTGKVNVSRVRFSPDGTLLTYLARREGDKATSVWAIPMRGGESYALLQHPTSVTAYEWRPDGGAIAFIATAEVEEDLAAQRAQGFTQEIYEEDRPQRLAFVAAVTAGAAAEAARLEGLPGNPYGMAWSPEGDRLVLDPAPTPLVDDQYMYRRLHIVDAAGQVQGRIDNPGKLGEFSWAPDGEAIVMVSAADINDPLEGRLMAISPATERISDLLPGLPGHVASFQFAADGKVIYLAAMGVGSRVGGVFPDGSQAATLLESETEIVDAISLDASGKRLALVVESPMMPRELFAMTVGDKAPRRITHSNPWLADIRMGTQEVVRWPARDGLEIEGLLIRPVDAVAGTPVPLIVVAHGGPESRFANGWLTSYSNPGQMAAGRGYAVFYPNYRGSTGRGVEFSKADQGDPMGREFEDTLDGIDFLVAQGIADASRVGITGGSYGGYTTAWASTRYSERFKAGVMFVGISNELSKAGTSDIPREMELVHLLTTPYESPELVLDRSPIMHVDNARTPLLILHGKEDPRVDPGQSHELYRALKLKGDVPVRLVLYPGEGHGNARAASRYDYSLRMLRWFDHFLMNGGTEVPSWKLEYGLQQ